MTDPAISACALNKAVRDGVAFSMGLDSPYSTWPSFVLSPESLQIFVGILPPLGMKPLVIPSWENEDWTVQEEPCPA